MKLSGIIASSGMTIGKPFIIADLRDCLDDTVRNTLEEDRVRYDNAIRLAKEQVQQSKERLFGSLSHQDELIFDAHAQILDDPEIKKMTFELYQNNMISLEVAYQSVMNRFSTTMSDMADPYFHDRSADVKDVANRVLRILTHCKDDPLNVSQDKVILVTRECTPSMIVDFAQGHLLGIVAEMGGYTSHAAILARSMKIPYLFRVEDALKLCQATTELMIDAFLGEITLSPTSEEKILFSKKLMQIKQSESEYSMYLNTSGITKDGHYVPVLANVSNRYDVDQAKLTNAEGIGLYRSEFLFLNRGLLPTEEEQLQAYRHAITAFANQPVVIRTFDIGGDKIPQAIKTTKEENPFLGNRGIRLSLSNPSMFRTQLRALLKSSQFGHLIILLPMISTIDEFRQAKRIILEEASEILKQDLPLGKYEVGMMVEVPSAAMTMDAFAKEADYFSIGSNDLMQYLFAADRTNEQVAYLYQPYHPSIYRVIHTIIEQAHRHGKKVGICGELGSDPNAVQLLVGLGIDEISVSPSAIPSIRKALAENSLLQMQNTAKSILDMATSEEVFHLLSKKTVTR